MKKLKLFIYSLAISLSIFALSAITQAQMLNSNFTNNVGTNANTVSNKVYSTADEGSQLFVFVALIIKTFLGLLGTIFVIMLILAGFKYMTSLGNKEKVGEANRNIRNSIIGLLIVVLAYAITYWIFANLPRQNLQ